MAPEIRTQLIRDVVATERERRRNGTPPRGDDDLLDEVAATVQSLFGASRPVINATGVILHTNLGRAPLSDEAVASLQLAAGCGNLEYDLSSGERGSRQHLVGAPLRLLTGADNVHVVGSNAAAVLLILTALCRRREVVVSRGQAVEIGGGFRVPDVLRQSGARLVEVGTTNRTRLADFAEAFTERTAALMHVHASNFRIVGFAESPDLVELAALAHARDVLLLVDNGSGALLDTADFGLAHEPTPAEALRAGADLVCFSGDKLLGGPQSGVIAGRGDLVRALSRHPLARAMRPDKLVLTALAATLHSYLRGNAVQTIPVWQMIALRPETIAARAHVIQESARRHGLELDVVPGESTIGGGSLPGETLPTSLVVLPPQISARRLRQAEIPVVGRTHSRRLHLDLRTVPPRLDPELLRMLLTAAGPRAC